MSKSKSKSGSRTQPGTTSRAPKPTRTLAFGTREEATESEPRTKTPTSPPEAWRSHAEDLGRAISQALARTSDDPATVAAIERAYAAFSLGGSTLEAIQPVAHLVGRAYEALHEPPVAPTPAALRACAHVLYNGLPRRVREQTTFVKIEKVVLGLSTETEAFPATVRATADLLGWTATGTNHMAQVVRLALATKAEPVA